MRLVTFLPPDGAAPLAGAVAGDTVTAFDDDGALSVLDLLASPERPEAAGASWPLEQVRLLDPARPRAIFGIGLNYGSHAAEQGAEPPERPIVFQKQPRASAPPGGPIRVPAVVRRLDYEGELAIVMGAGGAVAGFAVADDVTARDLQGREPQWTRAKGADTFCPWGPWITTADEVSDPGSLTLRTWVNGELRQEASTADLIFGVDELVAFLRETCTLEPGDLILTGTPSGVGMSLDPPRFLQARDRVRIEIDELGAIEHAVAP